MGCLLAFLFFFFLAKWSKCLGEVLEDFYSTVQLESPRGRSLLHVAQFWAVPDWGPVRAKGKDALPQLAWPRSAEDWREEGPGTGPLSQSLLLPSVPLSCPPSLTQNFPKEAALIKSVEADSVEATALFKGWLSPWD